MGTAGDQFNRQLTSFLLILEKMFTGKVIYSFMGKKRYMYFVQTIIQLFSTNFFHIIDGTFALPDFKNKTYKYCINVTQKDADIIDHENIHLTLRGRLNSKEEIQLI